MRVELSSEYGSQPLVIGAAHIALSDGGAAIKAGSDRVLTFSGNESVTIPPGAPVISDPVELSVTLLSSVAVSLFLPEVTPSKARRWKAFTAPKRKRSAWPSMNGFAIAAPSTA